MRRQLDGVRVLAKGELTSKGLKIEVTGASKPAIAAVEAAKGTLTVTAPTAAAAPEADAAAEAKA